MAVFIPVQDTWEIAINRGYLNTWHGRTSKKINRMPKDGATIKVRLAQISKNSCSTTTNKNSVEDHTRTDPIQEQNNGKTEIVMATVGEPQKIYTDQIRNSHMTSSRGKKCVLIMYLYDANAILEKNLKSRSRSYILEAHTKKV